MHPEHGRAMLKRIMEGCSDLGQLEQAPMLEGKKMIMIIAPKGSQVARPAPPRPIATSPTPVVEPSTSPPATGLASAETTAGPSRPGML